MKRQGYLFILTLFCFLVLIFTDSDIKAARSREVVLVTGEWPPYTSQHLRRHGIFTEVVTAVFKEMGVTPVYRFCSWKSAEEEVKRGRAFASFPHIITMERKKTFHFSDVVAFSNGRMFYNTRKYPYGVEFEDIHDMKRYRVGGGTSYRHEDILRNLGLSIEYIESEDQNIRKLFLRRIDLLPLDETAGLYHIQRLYPRRVNHFAFTEKPLTQDSLHLMISTRYPESGKIEKEFGAALQRIKENGVYQGICNGYGIVTSRCETLIHIGDERALQKD